jgi:tetratricopeptide (TPR) repeat protein
MNPMFHAVAVVAVLAGCAAQQLPADADLRQALAWYDRVIEDAPEPVAVERALAEEVFYLSYLGAGGEDGRLPIAYLAAMEGLTLRLQQRNGRSPWLAQAWYHVGEGRRLSGDLDGALAAYENALAIPCSGATGVYSMLSLERIETVGQALEDPLAELPPGRTGCPPAMPRLQFSPTR